jgi:hypothetical protein
MTDRQKEIIESMLEDIEYFSKNIKKHHTEDDIRKRDLVISSYETYMRVINRR